MPFLPLPAIKALLTTHKLHPNKALGQNFLIDEVSYEIILTTATLQPTDRVIEVGAGLGNLTGFLLSQTKHVLAVEIDRGFFGVLKDRFAGKSLTLIHGDMLAINNAILLGALASTNYKLVANIPYQITSPLLEKFIESDTPPRLSVLVIQRDVAERLAAAPPYMNALAASLGLVVDVTCIETLPPECFWPVPNVDSAIVKLVPHNRFNLSDEERSAVRALIKQGYAQKRKQLASVLAPHYNRSKSAIVAAIVELDLPPTARAQELSTAQWVALWKLLSSSYEKGCQGLCETKGK